jgi:hypothetical protein
MASVQTEVRELVEYIRSLGFQCAIEKDGHWHVYKNGKPVMKPGGAPVTLPGTPSDSKWRPNTISMLKAAKVIEDDPLKLHQRELARRDPEAKAAREQARALLLEQKQREEARKPSERQLRIRDAINETLAVLHSRGAQADFVRLAHTTATAKGMRVPKSPDALRAALQRLRTTEYHTADWLLDVFEVTLHDLGAVPAPQEKGKEMTKPEVTPPARSDELTVEFLTRIKSGEYETRIVGLERPGRRLEGGKCQCGCGALAVDLRGLKAHVRAAHIEAKCPDCNKWMPSTGIVMHRKWEAKRLGLPDFPVGAKAKSLRKEAEKIQAEIDKSLPVREPVEIEKSPPVAVPAEKMQELIDGKGITVGRDGPSQVRVSIEALEDLKALFYVQGVLDGVQHKEAAQRLEPLIARAVASIT